MTNPLLADEALMEAIAERRQDAAFMMRLRARVGEIPTGIDWKQAYEREAEKFQAETRRVSRIFDALDHWRWIADQEWSSDPHKVLRDCIAEARQAGDHIQPYSVGHYGGTCEHHWSAERNKEPDCAASQETTDSGGTDGP